MLRGLSIICICLYGLMALFLWVTKRGNARANKWLAIFLSLWVIEFIDGLLMLSGFYIEHPGAAFLTESFPFLYGPLLWGYTISVTHGKWEFRKVHLLHLLPFFVVSGLLFFSYHLRPVADKREILLQISNMNQSPVVYVVFILVYLHFSVYMILSLKEVKRVSKRLKTMYSQVDLGWLSGLLKLLFITIAFSALNMVAMQWGTLQHFEVITALLLLFMAVAVGWLLFRAFESPLVFVPVMVAYPDKSAVEKDEGMELIQLIDEVLKERSLYLQPDLSLEDLAKAVDENPRKISFVINRYLGKNFFELVNEHRIEAAMKIFREGMDPRRTVLETLYEVGFQSKSSFNTQFKKYTGETPSAYISRHQDKKYSS